MASAQLAGEDFMVGLDRRRADTAGQHLEPAPTPASTTAYGIAKRFTLKHLHGIETGIGQINTTMLDLLPPVRRASLLKVATIDGDATDVEVYGKTKEKAAHAYTGQLTLRPHIGFWAEAGVSLAAELMGGTEDPRSNCVDLLDRSISALPESVEKVRTRWDAGYFAADLADACVERDVEFAIGVKRTSKVMAAAKGLGRYTWSPAVGMDDTEVAVIDYLPGNWPKEAGIVCIARRTRIPVDRIPTARARKRRTIDKDHLTLALEGRIDEVYGYSFILTNLDVSTEEELAEVEFWYRHRTDIEELNKNAKHGTALRHLPSADHAVNSVWMWAGLLGCAISAWIQEITGLDNGNGRGRVSTARLRRELIKVPARISRRAGTTRKSARDAVGVPAHPVREPGLGHVQKQNTSTINSATEISTPNFRYSRIRVRAHPTDRFNRAIPRDEPAWERTLSLVGRIVSHAAWAETLLGGIASVDDPGVNVTVVEAEIDWGPWLGSPVTL